MGNTCNCCQPPLPKIHYVSSPHSYNVDMQAYVTEKWISSQIKSRDVMWRPLSSFAVDGDKPVSNDSRIATTTFSVDATFVDGTQRVFSLDEVPCRYWYSTDDWDEFLSYRSPVIGSSKFYWDGNPTDAITIAGLRGYQYYNSWLKLNFDVGLNFNLRDSGPVVPSLFDPFSFKTYYDSTYKQTNYYWGTSINSSTYGVYNGSWLFISQQLATLASTAQTGDVVSTTFEPVTVDYTSSSPFVVTFPYDGETGNLWYEIESITEQSTPSCKWATDTGVRWCPNTLTRMKYLCNNPEHIQYSRDGVIRGASSLYEKWDNEDPDKLYVKSDVCCKQHCLDFEERE